MKVPKFLKYKAKEVFQENGGYIVIYDWDSLDENSEPAYWENVVCYSKDGKIIWKINGMELSKYWRKETGFFTDIFRTSSGLLVTCFDTNRYKLDPENGRVEYFDFAK